MAATETSSELLLWKTILDTEWHHARGIVEFGIEDPSLSLYLAAQAEQREMFFRCYDQARPELDIPGFRKLDVFHHIPAVQRHLREHQPQILFINAVERGTALNYFSRHLNPLNLIVVGGPVEAWAMPRHVEKVDFYNEIGAELRSSSVVYHPKPGFRNHKVWY